MNSQIGPLNPEVMGIIGENMSNDIMDNCKQLINNIEKQTMSICILSSAAKSGAPDHLIRSVSSS